MATEQNEAERARAQVTTIVARWRARLDETTVQVKARSLAEAIVSDMLQGADERTGCAMLAALGEAGL
jgi:hypothetical protein